MPYAYAVLSSRALRPRVLGIVIHRALFHRTLDSRALRPRVLVYDVGHPFGDFPFLRHRR